MYNGKMIFDFERFAKNIKMLRLLGDYTQEALADEAGIGSRVTISQIEREHRPASLESLIKLSAVFNMTLEEVVKWEISKIGDSNIENIIKNLEKELIDLKDEIEDLKKSVAKDKG